MTAPAQRRGWVARTLPEGRIGWALSATALTDAVGNGFFLAGSAVFFTRYLDLSAVDVGVGLSAAGAAGLLASATAGGLTDRFGPRRVYVAFSLLQALLFACYPLAGGRVTFFLVVCLVGAADFAAAPAWGTLVARSVPEHRRVRTRAYLRAVYNIGFSVGSLLCALAIAMGTSAALLTLVWVNAVSFALGALAALAVPAPAPVNAPVHGRRFASLRDRAFLAVTGLSAVLTLHVSLLVVALPLWVVERTGVPASSVSALLVVNTILVVLFQVRASDGIATAAAAAVAARRSGLLLAMACLVFALSQGGGWAVAGPALLVGTLLLTGAELLQSASAWGLPYGLASEERLGEYQGTFGMAFSAQSMVGPAVTVLLTVQIGGFGWVVLAAALVMAALLIVPVTARAAAQVETTSVPT